jgi:alkylation response protein AidB-like acyl-CoA dehydrogenase
MASKHPVSPHQLALWTRYELTDLLMSTAPVRRPSMTKARPRSGRLQAVTRRVGARIREKCRELYGQVRGRFPGKSPRSRLPSRKITQIYEGTNQIQRMVMARALLKG